MDGTTILFIILAFFLSLFGLVSSGILLNNYRKNNDTTSTSYKFSIFGVVFFTVAVLGTIIWGTIAATSKSQGAAVTVQTVQPVQAPRAAENILKTINKSAQIVKAANAPTS